MAKLILLVGVPGSGKTTLSKRVVAKGLSYMVTKKPKATQLLYLKSSFKG